MSHDFLKEGFVYWEEVLSPDGTVRVLNGYRDGERSVQLIEPRILDTATGELLVDLWRTYHNYSVRFNNGDSRRITLTIENPYQGTRRIADIDLSTRTFAFRDTPRLREPLARLSERAAGI